MPMPRVLRVAEGSWGRAAIFEEKTKDDQGLKISKENLHERATRFQVPINPFEDIDSDEEENSSGRESETTCHNILPNLLACMFGTILEDVSTQLLILVESSNEIKIIKTKTDWNYLMKKKFGIKEPVSVDELDKIDENKLGCNEYNVEKLDSDRIYVTYAIKRTYLDLSLKKSFKTLEGCVNAILAVKKYRINLAEEEAKNRLFRRELARQLRQLRNHIKSAIYDTDVKIDELNAQVEDAITYSECRSRYIDNWQQARTEQHDDTIFDTESDYLKSVEYYKQKCDQENRAHLEVEMLTNITINETLHKVEDMMTKYDVDMESIDLKIQIQKNDYQNVMDKRKELQKTIKEHDKLMSDWVYFKDERERARQYREKMLNAAIAVQAWWRGLLVRRELGPFKPKKRKGAAGKKKEKY